MADRGLSAAAIAALGARTVETYKLIRLDFSTPVYFTTAPYDIDYDDGDGVQTYLSNSTLLRIPDMTESMKIRPQTIGIELSGAAIANYILLLAEEKNIDVYITKYINLNQNLITYSEQFDNSDWIKTATVTPNDAIAPDGTLTADYIDDTDNLSHQPVWQNSISIDSSNYYCNSIYIKKDSIPKETRFPSLYLSFAGSTTEHNRIMFDTSTGEYYVVAASVVFDGGVEDEGDYWRVWLSGKSNDPLNNTKQCYFWAALGIYFSGSWTSTTSAIGGCHAWGYQSAEGRRPIDYTKTEATAITEQSEGFLLFKGFTDSYQTSEDVGTGQASVKLNIANHWSNWEARSGTYLSDTEQRRIYAGDLGLEFSKVTDFFLPYWGDNGAWDFLFGEQYFLERDGYWSFGTYVPPQDLLGSAIADASDLPDTVKLPLVYGEVGLKGTPVFRTVTNQIDDIMWVVYALAEGECDSLVDIKFNDVSYTDASLSPYISATFHGGSTTQAADSTLVAESVLWTTAHQLKGICYVAVRYTLNEVWGGDPDPTFFIKGKKLYDPRTTTTVYSQNPALALLDYLTSTKYGKSLASTDIDGITAGANYCDTQVLPFTGSVSNINLFEINGVLSTSDEVKKNVESILFCMRGYLPWVSGKYTLVIERDDDTSEFSLDEDNITGRFVVKEAGLKSLANVMYYSVLDKDAGYQQIDVVSESATYQAADGRELKKAIKNKLENNRYRAQNRANTELKKTRQLVAVEATAGVSDAAQVQAGEVIDITRATQGWSAKLFRVTDMKLRFDGAVDFTLLEYEPTGFDWDYDVETTPPSNTTLPSPLDIIAPTTLVLTSGTSVLMVKDDGTIISRIKATWTAAASFFVTGYNVYIKSPTDAAKVFYKFVSGKESEEVFIDNVEDGILYTVYIHSVNTFGTESAALSDTETVVGKTAPPADVTGFIAAQNGDVVVFKWNQVADLDLAGYEIRYGAAGVSSWEDGTPLTSVTRGTNVTSADVPPGTWDFYIKAVDTTGNYSVNATSVTGVAIESTFDVITQEAQSPFDLFTTMNLADNTVTLWNGLSIATTMHDSTIAHTIEFYIEKDSIPKTTRFVLCRGRFDTGGATETLELTFDTSTGEKHHPLGTFTSTMTSLANFWKFTMTMTPADSANTKFDCEFYPAVGANTDLTTYTAAGVGSVNVWRLRLMDEHNHVLSGDAHDYSAWDEMQAGALTEGVSLAPVEIGGDMTNFVVHHTGKLVPQSQEADSDDGATVWGSDTVFEIFVNNPFQICTYTAPEIDIAFDDEARVWGSIESVLGVGETVGIANPSLSIDYKLDAGAYDGFESWSIGNVNLRFCKHKLTLDTDEGVAIITEFKPTVDQVEHVQRPLDADGNPTSVFVPAAGAYVEFPVPFHTTPYPMVTVASSTGKYAVINHTTPTSFWVRCFNTAGAGVDTYVLYEATGI